MNKILVEVSVPTIEKTFDIFIPVNKKIGHAIIQISQGVSELTDGAYIAKKNAILCNKLNGSIYNPNIIVKDSGLMNGSKVMLI